MHKKLKRSAVREVSAHVDRLQIRVDIEDEDENDIVVAIPRHGIRASMRGGASCCPGRAA
jgi:hypothetical protein